MSLKRTKKKKAAVSKHENVHLEIERKFLMRRVPVELLKKRKHEVIDIIQYYFNVKGSWHRYRVTTNRLTKEVKYIHTLKKPAGIGAQYEAETQIDKKEFLKLFKEYKNKCKIILKTRYVIKHKGLKF